MDILNQIIAVVAMVSLFVFSMNGFSKQLRKIGSDKFKFWLERATSKWYTGILLGAGLTAVIQSSSAVTSIVVALIDSHTIGFLNSIPVLMGANIGTTLTAWLVSMKITMLGPILLVTGTLISLIPYSIHLIGRSVFYLGLILFSLNLIGEALEPVEQSEIVYQFLTHSRNPFYGFLAGVIITAVVQSSSVTTGLAIILAGQGFLSLESGIGLVVGANLGTTTTAFIASIEMRKAAKRAALANFLFNLIGVVVFLPFIFPFIEMIRRIQIEITYQLALAHLIFNLAVVVLLLPFHRVLGNRLKKSLTGIPNVSI